ncbi:hypothetical protein BHE74_00025307 [Ensete ventricosum]|nr:hypothetical protein BHE74_00025307 [Ensete ventricosum]
MGGGTEGCTNVGTCSFCWRLDPKGVTPRHTLRLYGGAGSTTSTPPREREVGPVGRGRRVQLGSPCGHAGRVTARGRRSRTHCSPSPIALSLSLTRPAWPSLSFSFPDRPPLSHSISSGPFSSPSSSSPFASHGNQCAWNPAQLPLGTRAHLLRLVTYGMDPIGGIGRQVNPCATAWSAAATRQKGSRDAAELSHRPLW